MKKRTILISAAEDQRLLRLAGNVPFASAHAIARIALRLGLQQLETEPTRLSTEGLKQQVRS